jgi:hypothetical protein
MDEETWKSMAMPVGLVNQIKKLLSEVGQVEEQKDSEM